jgi:hypothetical protein
MDPQSANYLVESLGTTLRHGGDALEDVPKILRKVLEAGAWRDFTTRTGKRVQHVRFEDFVTTPPTSGIGGSMELVRRIAAADPVTLDLLDKAVQRPAGSNQHTQLVDNVNDHSRPTGNATEAALRRLRKDRPDLHGKVLEGKVSAHAAMVDAGFRRKTITVPLDVDAVVRALVKHFDAEQLREIAQRLTGS